MLLKNLPNPKEVMIKVRNSERMAQLKKVATDSRSRPGGHLLGQIILLLLAVILLLLAVLFLFKLWQVKDQLEQYQPEVIASKVVGNRVTISWVTKNRTNSSTVWYGTKTINEKATGIERQLNGTGKESAKYFHQVRLPSVKPNSQYQFQVGSSELISPVSYFRTPSFPSIRVMVKNLIENAHKENNSFDSTFSRKMEHPQKFFQKMQDAIENWHREMDKKVDRLFNH